MTPGRGGLSVVGAGTPHDFDAESSLLGAALLSPDAAVSAVEMLGPDDFYRPAHAAIFVAIGKLLVRGDNIDAITVKNELVVSGSMALVGDPAILISMQSTTPSTKNAREYAEIVLDCAVRRRQMHLAAELSEAARSGDTQATQRHLVGLESLYERRAGGLEAEDIAELMRNPLPPIEPELLRRTDGRAVLIRGSLSTLSGEPSAGKSLVMAEASRQLVIASENIVILDYEAGPRMFAQRLVELGAPIGAVQAHLTYVRPGSFDPAVVARWVVALAPALVVVDSLAASLSQNGIDEDDNGAVLRFLSMLCRPLTDFGAAVVCIDHVVKSKENRGRFTRGAGAKLYDVDAAFSLELVEAFARGHDGSAILRIQKDRNGAIGPEGTPAATVRYRTDVNGRFSIELDPPDDASGEPYAGPTRCMDAIEEILLERGDELSTRQLIATLRSIGKSYRDAIVRDAAEQLALDDSRPVLARSGARGARLYRFKPVEDMGLGTVVEAQF